MKPPAFPFYVKDWLAGTRRLSYEMKGIYIELLAWSWDNGPVPYRLAEVAAILGLSRAQVEPKWKALRRQHFRKSVEGYVNPRLERERSKCKAFAKLQAERGRRSGLVRTNRGSTAVEPALNLALALSPSLAEDQDHQERAVRSRAQFAETAIKPLTKIAHLILDDVGQGHVPADEAIDELKLRAARARIPYDGTVVTQALKSAVAQRQKGRP